MKYGLRAIRKVTESPSYIFREANKAYYSRFFTYDYNPTGIDVFQEDWDNLILLDACRFDAFRDHVELPGELSARESRASSTRQWIRANFGGRQLHDTVYVAGNPRYSQFHQQYDAEVHAHFDVHKELSEQPKAVMEKALEWHEKYQNKRLLIHFLPPHHPYIGSTADELLPPHNEQQSEHRLFWHRVEAGDFDLTDEQLWDMYIENLNRVIKYVEKLLTELSGKTVITADHGELLGERTDPLPVSVYGHPPHYYVNELVKIPWHIFEDGSRKDINAEGPANDNESALNQDEMKQRLIDLGYRT